MDLLALAAVLGLQPPLTSERNEAGDYSLLLQAGPPPRRHVPGGSRRSLKWVKARGLGW